MSQELQSRMEVHLATKRAARAKFQAQLAIQRAKMAKVFTFTWKGKEREVEGE